MQLVYEKSVVRGETEDGKTVTEEIIHLENQDPLLMAMRRNGRMTECPRIRVVTTERFKRFVDEYPHTKREDLPKVNGGYIEYEW